MLKKIKSFKYLLFLGVTTLLTITIFSWFLKTDQFLYFKNWAQNNALLFFFTLVIIKIIGIVWPPVPGGIFTLGAIPVFGWLPAYLADFSGSLIGSSLTFFLGKKYGYPFLKKIFDERTIEKIKSVKIKKDKEVESIFVLRVLSGSIFLEAICYGAGLFNVKFINFFVASLLSHVVVGVPVYYFAKNIVSSDNIFLNIVSLIIVVLIFWKLKGRYLE